MSVQVKSEKPTPFMGGSMSLDWYDVEGTRGILVYMLPDKRRIKEYCKYVGLAFCVGLKEY